MGPPDPYLAGVEVDGAGGRSAVLVGMAHEPLVLALLHGVAVRRLEQLPQTVDEAAVPPVPRPPCRRMRSPTRPRYLRPGTSAGMAG